MFVGACMCMWCMYGYVYFWWSMCCMYVYMHLCRYVLPAPLIGDACDAHVCIWCMFVNLCTHVFVVHVYVHGASMHKCVFGGACMCIKHTYM